MSMALKLLFDGENKKCCWNYFSHLLEFEMLKLVIDDVVFEMYEILVVKSAFFHSKYMIMCLLFMVNHDIITVLDLSGSFWKQGLPDLQKKRIKML